MSLRPLLDASGVIQLHAFAAMAALVLGGVQLTRRKGDTPHRVLGYAWVGLMLMIALSSFWIHTINQWNGFSLIHALSVLTLITAPLALHAVRRGNVHRHRVAMLTLFWSALVVAGLFTVLPGRIIHRVLFG